MRIYMKDVRASGMCVTGARKWFKLVGLDFKAFLDNGIAVEELKLVNDAMANKVIEVATNGRK